MINHEANRRPSPRLEQTPPKWIRDVYHSDPAVHRIVKDWRMTKKPLADLFEKLAIKMFELKNVWQMTYENAIKNAPIPSRIIFGE